MFNEKGNMVGVIIFTVLAGIITGSLGLVVASSLTNTQKIEDLNLRQINSASGMSVAMSIVEAVPCSASGFTEEEFDPSLKDSGIFFKVNIELQDENGAPSGCVDAEAIKISSTGYASEEEEKGYNQTVIYRYEGGETIRGYDTVTQVSSGGKHSLAITDKGEIYSWGLNNYGQLGTRDTIYRVTPVLLKIYEPGKTLAKFDDVSAGSGFSLAATDKGAVYSWGNNASGQLGDGSNNSSLVPVRLSSISNIVMVSAGGGQSLALNDSGNVYSWGNNTYGELGVGNNSNKNVPTAITGLSNISFIDAGKTHSIAVSKDGKLYTWGDNSKGQLGIGSTVNKNTPQEVSFFPSNGLKIKEATAGDGYTLALTEEGKLYTWGVKLGEEAQTTNTTPVLIRDAVK